MISNVSFKNPFVHQGHLEQCIRSLFEGAILLTNVRKNASITNPVTGSFLEIDIWLPNLQLCFEFQDAYHYVTTWSSQLTISDIQVKDSFKHDWLRSQGQTVVVVPCWWDGTTKSLQNTINFLRPEFFDPPATPDDGLISLNESHEHFIQPTVPDIGELMLASFPSSISISEIVSIRNPWWIGEKYDGIRICWNPKRNKLYGRYGVALDLAEAFNSFGKYFIDGELWFGRGTFNEAQKVVSPQSAPTLWEFLRIIAFDDPSREHTSLSFEKRYVHIATNIPVDHPFLLLAFRIFARSSSVVTHMSREIIESGGEGIVLRKRGSVYTSGRSRSLLKLKATRGDKEGLVTDFTSEGFVVIQLADGNHLNLPEPELDVPVKIGDIVTFTYEHHSRSEVPLNPQIIRVRHDISWRNVLRDHAEQIESEIKDPSHNVKPFGFWLQQKRKNMRLFFEQFAGSNRLDPLIPEDWYSVSAQTIMEMDEGSTILSYYNGSIIRALVQLFPEVHFDESKFFIVPQKYWQVVANRRKFFFDLAKVKGFDPLLAKNWYSLTEKTMMEFKGANSVARYYNSSITRALMHLFPELNFNREAFSSATRTSWRDIKKRRAFFTKIAADKGFDPLIPSNWYQLSFNTFNSFPGANTIRKIYGGFKNALCQLYPTLRFDKTKFVSYSLPTKYWKNNHNSKEFFEMFAKEKGFDSLKPENWYSFLSKKSILAYKGGVTLLKYYGGFGKALIHNYPDIGLDINLLPRPSNYWADRGNRRKLLESYAQEVGFDPLIAANWYSVNKKSVQALKGGNSMLVRYANSHIRAIMDTFPEIGLKRDLFVGRQKKLYPQQRKD
eukprot:Phypoly_transcript_02914.p1 GENE.Phypoly_transcript_02914~~Phypoly_transcript_02914.p1  ORF type:complete len:836 (+),score=73.69 Phypoly_transcript_02914:81-2588(+)